MKIGKAAAIFEQIDSDNYTDKEKALAIYNVLKLETHNSIKKASILKVTQYLFDKLYEIEDSEVANNESI
jgi:hypothetical protein